MEKLKFNPDNAKYYSEEFIKGFECGVERQFNADTEEKPAEWVYKNDPETGIEGLHCSNCGYAQAQIYKKFCANCGARMKEVE